MRRIGIAMAITLSAASGTALAAGCAETNPSGPRLVIECAAQELYKLDGVTLWKTKLFSTSISDMFCNSPQTSLYGNAQTEMYAVGCKDQKGDYFSYDSFLAADEELKTRLGDAYKFMREGAYEVKLQELANFLATAAQETTKGEGKYQVDGLYQRYENGALLAANPQFADPVNNPEARGNCIDVPANPDYENAPQQSNAKDCRNQGLSSYKSTYYPFSTFAVAVTPDGKLVNTSVVVDSDFAYDTATNVVSKTGYPTLYTKKGGTYAPPSGYKWQYMNQIGDPGYWVGMGNLQLTGDSMMKFFGWYHQKVLSPAVAAADYMAFVKRYLGDGKLAWMGGLWYWNFRVKGEGAPNAHAILAGSTKDACHDIGIATRMVNGSCNDAWGRDLYYGYFKSTVFKLSSVAQTTPTGLSSYQCSVGLADYCMSK